MPAYAKPIPERYCQQGHCPRRATREVYNGRNALIGYFCGVHAKRLVASLNND